MKIIKDLGRFYYWFFVSFLGFILLSLLIAGPAWLWMRYMSSDERASVEEFFTNFNSGNLSEVQRVLHESLREQVTEESFATLLNAEPYTDYEFTSYELKDRVWSLAGVATTKEGCESSFTYRSLNKVVIQFNINPVCPRR